MWIKLSTTFGYYKHFIFLAFQKLPDSTFTHSILINISRINQIFTPCSYATCNVFIVPAHQKDLPIRTKLPVLKDTSLALNPVFDSIIYTMIFYITTTALTRASFYSKSKGYYQPLQYTIK